MNQLVLWLPAISLISALLTHLLGDVLGRSVVKISIVGAAAVLALSACLLGFSLLGGDPHLHMIGASWGGLLFDPLSALMALMIAGVSFLVRVYSIRYMAEEPGYVRFFVLLDVMTACLLIMIAAGDLVTLIISWHLIGLLLYFLLGHDTRSHPAYRYGFWSLMICRLGDLPLVMAALLLFHNYDSWWLPEIFEKIAAAPDALTFLDLPVVEVAGGLVALSAFARSAQFLLHTWLPYAMEGPTPVSALMHAGIVNAGGILINRFAPVYVHTDGVLHWVFVVGLFTAIIGSVLMLSQNDVKKSLGYSTMGQMGFMVMECGVGAFSLAIFHLIAHGLFKGTMFLSAGGVIGEARHDDGVPKEDLYTFIVERRSPAYKQPWLIMAVTTLAVPIFVLFLSHWVIAPDLFQKQGAVVLLFFGWVTGAQLLFSTYHMGVQNPWRLVGLIIVSFVIVVIGYTLISHTLDRFLYPNPEFVVQLYRAASIDILSFSVLVSITALVIVVGWLRVYYQHRHRRDENRSSGSLWLNFYALISREFYINDFYAGLYRSLLSLSSRLNILLRWG